MGPPPAPILDVHAHVNGVESAKIYARVREVFGVSTTYSMSMLHDVLPLRELLGETIRFIAVPNYFSGDRRHEHTAGFLEAIGKFHALGSRIVKFWAAPRARDYGREVGDPELLALDSPVRRRAMELADSLGMMFMAHIADPDTWFKTKYADSSVYGTKAAQYTLFEEALERHSSPWIAAHMGGWPENLEFLDGLLTRHDNLHLDTAATKWMVRELSSRPRAELLAFLSKWRGRILFGSDIVTMDEHLSPAESPGAIKSAQASSPEQAFELYASRYWAFRTLFETSYDGESPIADSDLMMVEPSRYNEMSAPRLRGLSLPPALLRSIYHDAAEVLLGRWHREHP